MFPCLNNVNQSFTDIFGQCKEYSICLILFLSFSELFPAFNWAKEIGNLLSIWFGVKIFKPFSARFSWLNSRISFTIKNLLRILIMIELGFPFEKRILAKLKQKTTFALTCFVTKTSQFSNLHFKSKFWRLHWWW